LFNGGVRQQEDIVCVCRLSLFFFSCLSNQPSFLSGHLKFLDSPLVFVVPVLFPSSHWSFFVGCLVSIKPGTLFFTLYSPIRRKVYSKDLFQMSIQGHNTLTCPQVPHQAPAVKSTEKIKLGIITFVHNLQWTARQPYGKILTPYPRSPRLQSENLSEEFFTYAR